MKILTTGLDDYLRDESNLAGGRAAELALPDTLVEVVQFMRHCAETNTKLTISGARTGIVGGAVPFGGAILSTERMKAITEFEYEPATDDWRVKVEPGVSLADLQQSVQTKTVPDSQTHPSEINGLSDFKKSRAGSFSRWMRPKVRRPSAAWRPPMLREPVVSDMGRLGHMLRLYKWYWPVVKS